MPLNKGTITPSPAEELLELEIIELATLATELELITIELLELTAIELLELIAAELRELAARELELNARELRTEDELMLTEELMPADEVMPTDDFMDATLELASDMPTLEALLAAGVLSGELVVTALFVTELFIAELLIAELLIVELLIAVLLARKLLTTLDETALFFEAGPLFERAPLLSPDAPPPQATKPNKHKLKIMLRAAD